MNEELLRNNIITAITQMYEQRIAGNTVTVADDDDYAKMMDILSSQPASAWVAVASEKKISADYMHFIQLNG